MGEFKAIKFDYATINGCSGFDLHCFWRCKFLRFNHYAKRKGNKWNTGFQDYVLAWNLFCQLIYFIFLVGIISVFFDVYTIKHADH